MAIQIAVSTYSLLQWRTQSGKSLEDTLHWISEQGVGGVEFAGLDDQPVAHPVKRAGELNRLCDSLGLLVAGYCVGAELLCDPSEQAKVVADLKEAVDVTAALGASNMRHDVTRGPAVDSSRSWLDVLNCVVPAVRQVCEYAASKRIRTSVENHGFYLQTADRVNGLVDAVGHQNFGVTLDMGNFLCLNQDPVDAVRKLASRAYTVHAKDFFVKDKERMPRTGWFATPTSVALRGAILGHGQIDIPAQLAALREVHYSGWISLEFEGIEEPTSAVAMGLEYLKDEIKKAGLQ